MGTAHHTPNTRTSSINPRELSKFNHSFRYCSNVPINTLRRHQKTNNRPHQENIQLNNQTPGMDSPLLQPLYVDCSVEYELDMTRFPGWDDPRARAEPTLLLRQPDRPCIGTSLEDELEHVLQKLSTTEEEFQTLLRETIMTEEELQGFVQDFCPGTESGEDDLTSIIDDVYSYADLLSTMTGAVSPLDHAQYQETLELATQTDSFIPDGRSFEDFLSDSYVSDPASQIYFSSVDHLSPAPTVDCDVDFLINREEPRHSCRKRQISDDSEQPSAKRQRNHGDDMYNELVSTFFTDSNHGNDLYNELVSTFFTDSSEDVMTYGFSGCVRD